MKMKFALVNGERCVAKPKLSGNCEICNSLVIAKCGKIKIWHWAHKGKLLCDPWWENETDWHRNWKNYFPESWQEVTHRDANGEIHRADVKTSEGMVIEFQHSFIPPEEREVRTAFYKRIIWVVDGARVKDKEQFFKFLNELEPVNASPPVRKVYLGESPKFGKSALLKEWCGISVPVFFDFGEGDLWCLLPDAQNVFGHAVAFPRNAITELHKNGVDQTKIFEEYLNKLNLAAQGTLIQSQKQHAPSAADILREQMRRKYAYRGLR